MTLRPDSLMNEDVQDVEAFGFGIQANSERETETLK